MQPESLSLQTLADRVSRGDPDATTTLWRQLHVNVSHFVRRVLRGRSGPPLLVPHIRAELRRLVADDTALTPWEETYVIQQVAGRICDSVVTALQHSWPREQSLLDTVLA